MGEAQEVEGSGLSAPRAARSDAACLPNSIRRGLPGCNSRANFAIRMRNSARNRSKSDQAASTTVNVGIAHHDHGAVRMASPPLLDPKIVGVMKIDVRQQRRYDALNAKGNFGLLADQIGMAVASSGRWSAVGRPGWSGER